MKKIAAIVLTLAIASGAATAAEDDFIETFGAWSVFAADEAGGKTCYVASVPERSEGKYTKRGEVWAMVTQRPAEKTFDVVSLRAGYTFEKGSDAVVRIGGKSFKLFTDGAFAWAYDVESDKALAQAMKRGSEMVVLGTSNRGTKTTDTYSLTGFTKAYATAAKACGL